MFIVGDAPESLTFTVTVDERRFASLGNLPDEPIETDIRRRYVTRAVQQRLHQQEFRERVLEAYQRHCAICRLRHDQLLEAAHIVGDREMLGAATVPNGIALCSLHHAAFDAHLMTVRPDYHIEVRPDVLEETDGPMLIHGLQGFHGKSIRVPSGTGCVPMFACWRFDSICPTGVQDHVNRLAMAGADEVGVSLTVSSPFDGDLGEREVIAP